MYSKSMLATAAVAMTVTVSGAAEAAVLEPAGPPAVTATANAPQGIPSTLFTRFKVMLPRYAKFNSRVKKFVEEAGPEALDYALDSWMDSRGDTCRTPIAPNFCRPEPPRLITGVALSWGGRVPGVWTAASSPRKLSRTLQPGTLQSLSCYVSGDRATDGGIKTSLWYRLSGGGYVNDGWLETGSNQPVVGVPRC
jgi:hypothetical protein